MSTLHSASTYPTILIKIVSVVLAMVILQLSNCHSLAILSKSPPSPVSNQQQQVTPNRLEHHSSMADDYMKTGQMTVEPNPIDNRQHTTIAGQPIFNVRLGSETKVSKVLTKRSVGEETNSPYAGHSIMRFGRAPHNIMHFGKRSDDESLEIKTERDLLMADGSASSDDLVGKESVRYVLIPMLISSPHILPEAASIQQSSFRHALSKKSAENLETTRGVFMHFG